MQFIIDNKVIISNLIILVATILWIYSETIINRKLYLTLCNVVNSLYIIAYFILGAYLGTITCIYSLFKHSILVFTSKKDKVIVKTYQMLLLNIPYFILFLFALNKGWQSALYSLCAFLVGFGLVFKTDKAKHIWFSINTIGYCPYDFINGNIMGIIANITVSIINIFNTFRINKHGEKHYYKGDQA